MMAQPRSSILTTSWTSVGPNQIASTAFGNVTGRITAIAIDPAGGPVKVLADGSVQQGDTTAGQIDLQAFANPSTLQRAGSNRFTTAGATPAAATGTVVQGSLEQSSVDLSSCMVDMIRLNRLFEMSMKVASTITNDMDAHSISDVSTGR